MLRWFLSLPIHLKVAIIIAPFLAIGGYALVDLWKRPETLQNELKQMAFIQFAPPSTCQLSRQHCDLQHDQLQVKLSSVPASQADLVRLIIQADKGLRGIQMAVVQNGKEDMLIAQPLDEAKTTWYAEFPRSVLQSDEFVIRIALAQVKTIWMAEFPAQL